MPPEIAHLAPLRLFSDSARLDEWRTSVAALRITNAADGYILEGKVDEILVGADGALVPADYKSSGDPPKHDKQKYYRLQLHGYALMLYKKGYRVADHAYLLHYYTKDRSDTTLAMEFAAHADLVRIDLEPFERKLGDMVKFLERDFPGASALCRKCAWAEQRKKH